MKNGTNSNLAFTCYDGYMNLIFEKQDKKNERFAEKVIMVIDEISGDNLLPEISSPTSLSSSAMSIVANNTNLLSQILLRLPVKSLAVSKSVSKQWLSIISEPLFVQNYCLQNRPSVQGLFLTKSSSGVNQEIEYIVLDGKVTESAPFKTLTFATVQGYIRIEHSCNGLFCCSSSRSAIGRPRYYVYSPVTKRSKVLSRPQVNEQGYLWICSASLAFDPLQSPHYKVVCIWRNDMVNHHIEIYSSSTDSWRVSECPLPAPKIMFYTSGVYWNGSLHWISLRNSSFYFDIDQDLIKVFPMPPINPGIDKIRVEYFGVCKGHLNLIETSGSSMTSFDVLEMESDYSGWNVKYHVNIEALTNLYFERLELLNHSEFSVLLVHEEEDSSSLVLQIQNKIISYDIRSRMFLKLHDLSQVQGNVCKLYRYYDAYQYISTLSSV